MLFIPVAAVALTYGLSTVCHNYLHVQLSVSPTSLAFRLQAFIALHRIVGTFLLQSDVRVYGIGLLRMIIIKMAPQSIASCPAVNCTMLFTILTFTASVSQPVRVFSACGGL
jgi:hypothetical protein